ncbi:MAG: glycosyltransferase family 2 protein [candidate division WOR-3 bacterium]
MQKASPLVSVIMPAYNAEKYISEAIESILNQTFKDFEFIIVDDASTDKTWEIIQEYARKDDRIIAVRNEKNLYIAENRNKGLSYARGKYIVWQDADDISIPTRIEKQVAFMEAHPEVGICGAYIQSFNENGDLDIRKYATDDAILRKHIFKFSPVAQPVAIVRKESIDKVGYFNPAYPPAEDIDMSFRIGEYYKFANIPEVLLKYREHSSSATFTKLRKQIKATLAIRRRYAKKPSYVFNISDCLAYIFTVLTLLAPPFITIGVFKKLRNLFLKSK